MKIDQFTFGSFLTVRIASVFLNSEIFNRFYYKKYSASKICSNRFHLASNNNKMIKPLYFCWGSKHSWYFQIKYPRKRKKMYQKLSKWIAGKKCQLAKSKRLNVCFSQKSISRFSLLLWICRWKMYAKNCHTVIDRKQKVKMVKNKMEIDEKN
jgi:hypothetical protein